MASNWLSKLNPTQLILGAATSLFGAKTQTDAANDAAKQEMALAKPWLDMGKWALPRERSFISDYMFPRLGKESSLLKAGHQKNLEEVGRQKERGLAESRFMFGKSGRGRGEKFRIGEAALESTNRANLGYAEAQDTYKTGNENAYLSALVSAGSKGQIGIAPAMQSIQTRQAGAQGMTDLWGDIGSEFIGDWMYKRKLGQMKSAGVFGT